LLQRPVGIVQQRQRPDQVELTKDGAAVQAAFQVPGEGRI
jgi:hypothetical protein